MVLLFSCTSSEKIKDNNEFSVLYQPFIQQLKQSNLKLIKYVKKGEVMDTIIISKDSVNWYQELKLFVETKIPKSAYSDYEIKSFENNCKKQFQTSSNKHSVKKYQIDSCNGGLIVNIDVVKSSPLYEFDYHLELNEEGYLIEATSDVEFAYNSAFRIEGKFTKEN